LSSLEALGSRDEAVPPTMLIDDLAAELDQDNQSLVLDELASLGVQTLLTGIAALPPALIESNPIRTFHVEQGQVTRLLY